MYERLKGLFNEPNTLAVVVTSAAVGIVAGTAQGLLPGRYGGWRNFLAVVLTAIVVSVIVGLAINDFVPSETLRFAIIGVSGVVSEDIWFGLRSMGRKLRNDPLGMVIRVMDALRGRPHQGQGGDPGSPR